MNKLTFETIPQAVGEIIKKLDWLEEIMTASQTVQQDTSKKKYNLPEAAAYCGMAEPTFRTYIYKRKVAGTKFGKAWLFLELDLDKFILDFRVPTQKELEIRAFDKLTNPRSKYHGK